MNEWDDDDDNDGIPDSEDPDSNGDGIPDCIIKVSCLAKIIEQGMILLITRLFLCSKFCEDVKRRNKLRPSDTKLSLIFSSLHFYEMLMITESVSTINVTSAFGRLV